MPKIQPRMVNNLISLAVSKKLKFFNGDEFIEGTGSERVSFQAFLKTIGFTFLSKRSKILFNTIRILSWGNFSLD